MFCIALGFQRDTEQVEDRPAVLVPLPHSVLPERVGAAGGGEDHGAAAVGVCQIEGIEAGIPFIEEIDIVLQHKRQRLKGGRIGDGIGFSGLLDIKRRRNDGLLLVGEPDPVRIFLRADVFAHVELPDRKHVKAVQRKRKAVFIRGHTDAAAVNIALFAWYRAPVERFDRRSGKADPADIGAVDIDTPVNQTEVADVRGDLLLINGGDGWFQPFLALGNHAEVKLRIR